MRAQLARLPEWLEYFGSLVRVAEGTCPPFKGAYLNYVQRVPLGVVAQITPWVSRDGGNFEFRALFSTEGGTNHHGVPRDSRFIFHDFFGIPFYALMNAGRSLVEIFCLLFFFLCRTTRC